MNQHFRTRGHLVMNDPETQAPRDRPGRFSRFISFIFAGPRTSVLAFLAAIVATAFGAVAWLTHHFQRPPEESQLPKYLPLSTSFAGGFLLGCVVRGFAKTAALVTGLLVLAVGYAAHLTTDPQTSTALHQQATWLKQRAAHAKSDLLHLLPSATGAALGAFAGSRKPKS